jgi:hypothetical protein
MSQLQYSFSIDAPSGRQRIHIEPLNEYYWLIDFLQMCSFVERCDFVRSGLETAMRNSEPWEYCLNETLLRYDSSTEMVIAVFLCGDAAAKSTMDTCGFLGNLSKWRERLLPAGRLGSLPC